MTDGGQEGSNDENLSQHRLRLAGESEPSSSSSPSTSSSQSPSSKLEPFAPLRINTTAGSAGHSPAASSSPTETRPLSNGAPDGLRSYSSKTFISTSSASTTTSDADSASAAASYAQALSAHHRVGRRQSLVQAEAKSSRSGSGSGSSSVDQSSLQPPEFPRLGRALTGPAPSASSLRTPPDAAPPIGSRRGSLQAAAMLKAGLFAEQQAASAGSSAVVSPACYSSPSEPSAAHDLAEPTWSLPGSATDSIHSESPSRRSSVHRGPGGGTSLSSAAASLHQNQHSGAAAAAAAAASANGNVGAGSSGFSAMLSRTNTARHSGSDGSKQHSSTVTTPGSASPVHSSTAAGGPTRGSSNSGSLPTTHPNSPTSGYATPSGMHHQPPKVLETHHLQLQTHAPSGRRMINQYIIEDELGRGVHGKVRLARDTESGERVAVKIVERESKKRLGLATGGWQARMMGSSSASAVKEKERQAVAAAAEEQYAEEGAPTGKQRAVDFADPPTPTSSGPPASPRAQMYAAARYGRWGEGAPSRPTFADLELQKRREKEAAKARKAQMMTTDQKVRREIAILKKLSHENVVRLREVIDDPQSKKIFLVLEYMAGGEVIWKDARGFPTLTVAETRSIMRDVVLGLEYLHYQGIIHRDIKPANLLWDEERRVKISDFGVSHFSYALLLASGGVPSSSSSRDASVMDEHELAKTAGSPAFFAPELCQVGEASNPSTASASARNTGQSIAGGIASEIGTREFPWMDGKSGESGRASPRQLGSPAAVTPSGRGLLGKAAAGGKSKPKVTKAIDVWALGVTLYCLLFGHVPFTAESEFALFAVVPREDYSLPSTAGADRLLIGPRKPRWRSLPQWTDEEADVQNAEEDLRPDVDEASLSEEARMLRNLLDRLLDKNPATRIKLEEVKAHPWIVQDLEDAHGWLKETDPAQLPSVDVTHEEVEDALTGFSKMKRRIKRWQSKLLHSLTGTQEHQQQYMRTGLGRPRSRSTAEIDALVPPSPGGKSQRRGFLSPGQSGGFNLASGTTPTADDQHHHPHGAANLFRKGSAASRKTTAGRSTRASSGGHTPSRTVSRSQPGSRPSSPEHKDAASMLRQIAQNSAPAPPTSAPAMGWTTASIVSRDEQQQQQRRRFLWKRRSTSRPVGSAGGISPTRSRPSVDRSSSDGHMGLSRTSTARPSQQSSGISAPNTVSPTALNTVDLPLSEPNTTTHSPEGKGNARHRSSRGDFWHRFFSESSRRSLATSNGSSATSRPGTANSDASASGGRLKSSLSEDKGHFRGLKRRQHQPLSLAFGEKDQGRKAATADSLVATADGAQVAMPARGDSFGVIALDDDESYEHGPASQAKVAAGGLASHQQQNTPPAPRPQHIDVDDLDDELELSDDDLGIDSRRDSYMRNDGRGWTQHYSMATGSSSEGVSNGGASPGAMAPVDGSQDRLGVGAPRASSSLTPSVEGGYNLFKPPYNGRVDLFDGVDPFDVARQHAENPDFHDPPDSAAARDDLATTSGGPSLSAITGGLASAMPINSQANEAAALRRGSAQLDGLVGSGGTHSSGLAGVDEEHAEIAVQSATHSKLAPRSRGYVEEEDSRFADADESINSPVADEAKGAICGAPPHPHIFNGAARHGSDDDCEGEDDDEQPPAPQFNSLLNRWGPAAKATRLQQEQHFITDDYSDEEDDSGEEEDEEDDHDTSRQSGATMLNGTGRLARGRRDEDQDEGECVSFEARARPRSKSVLTNN
ncbi:kinase-like protein [Jaminaea rosea]|uniref:Kinase-like protein n=1 Tax=Jaminaea rosea TaxID=1569628 RepID=A0A316US39_9BASI|nr:kinase-like protein [Jaminaea rosea]PWN28102.1 kinase-like protein [Jaminaea rosea]